MPYFVFEIRPSNDYKLLDSSENYREARKVARDRRKSVPPGEDVTVRMVFAADATQGQTQLSARREPRPLGEDG